MMKVNFIPFACLMFSAPPDHFLQVNCTELSFQQLARTVTDLQQTTQCLQFKCASDSRLEGTDLCYKSDYLDENFGIVHLKACPSGTMCNGKLNRCLADPFNVYEGKLPGQQCAFSYQCASGSCIE